MKNGKYSKQLTRILLLVALTSILVFVISIKPTIALKQDVKKAKLVEVTEEQYATQYEQISKDRTMVDRYFSDNTSGYDIEDKLFGIISSTSDTMGVYLLQYPTIHSIANNGFKLITQEITMYGEFIPLLQFMGILEKDVRFFVHSASFTIETDRRATISRLLLKLYIQSIKKINDTP